MQPFISRPFTFTSQGISVKHERIRVLQLLIHRSTIYHRLHRRIVIVAKENGDQSRPNGIAMDKEVQDREEQRVLLQIAQVLSSAAHVVVEPFREFNHEIYSTASPGGRQYRHHPAGNGSILFLFVRDLRL